MKKTVWILLFLFLFPALAQSQIVRNGTSKTYYETGELKTTVPYKDGKKHGVEKNFSPDGTLLKEIYYQEGERLGEVLPEPKRDFGKFKFVKSVPFWIILILGAGTLWFAANKFLFRNLPS